MPEYEVTDPTTGKTLILTGDSPPTEEELEQIFAEQSGSQPVESDVPRETGLQDLIQKDVGLLQKAKSAFTGEDLMTPEMRDLPGIGSAPEMNEMSVRALKAALGTMATGDAEELKSIFTKQYGDDVSFSEDAKGNTIVNFPSGSYPLNKPGFSMQDIPKLVADMGLFGKFGMGKTILGTGVKSGAVEVGIEAAEAGVGGDFTPRDVVEASVLSGLFKTGEEAIGAIYRAIKGKGVPDPELMKLIDEGKDQGIPVMTSDVMPPQTFPGKAAQQTGEKVPLVGTAAMRETQQEARKEAVDVIAQKYDVFSYEAIIESLKAQKDKIKNAAGNVLESSGNKLNDFGEIVLRNTDDAIEAATEELTKPGVIQSSKALNDLNELVEAIRGNPQTYTSLKENRTAFREIVNSLDPTARSQLTSRAKAMLKNVEGGMTRDMKTFAKENLTSQEFAKLNRANAVYAEEAKKLTKTKLKNVLDKGEFTPEAVKSMIFSQSPSEMKLLYNSLTTAGKKHARAAVINKIVTDLSKRQHGFTPNSFATELKKYGPQLKTFFKGTERRQLEGLRRVLDATRRAQEAAATTTTGQQLMAPLYGYALFTDLGATLGASGLIGGLSRLYESAPVRNALLRLGSMPKGSSAFEKALSEAQKVLNAAAQNLRDQVKKPEDQ